MYRLFLRYVFCYSYMNSGCRMKKNHGQVYTITKKELIDLLVIKEIPVSVLAKKFGVSSNSVRKRAKRFGIDIPRFWRRKSHTYQ